MTTQVSPPTEIYQGQFGDFTINDDDRRGVVIYRAGLAIAAFSFAVGSGLVLLLGTTPGVLRALTPLFALFSVGLGVSLWTIHIYLAPLHRLLQVFWAIGTVAGLALAIIRPEPLAEFVYNHPNSLFGIGFSFAALTGIFFKEAFCFNRFETKFLTPLIPLLLLGHLTHLFPVEIEQSLLGLWTMLFVIFAVRKLIQPIPPDIGDKSVFDYLKQQRLEA